MKIIIIFMLSVFACSAQTLNVVFKKQSNGDYKCTLTNTGKDILFSDPSKTEFILMIRDASGTIAFNKVDADRTNMHWKHIVILLKNREDVVSLNTFAFMITKTEIEKTFGVDGDKVDLVGVKIFLSQLDAFQRDGIVAMKMVEIH